MIYADENGVWEPCADNPQVLRLVTPSGSWMEKKLQEQVDSVGTERIRVRSQIKALCVEKLAAQELGEDVGPINAQIKELKKALK